jgi:hypothetical protein
MWGDSATGFGSAATTGAAKARKASIERLA